MHALISCSYNYELRWNDWDSLLLIKGIGFELNMKKKNWVIHCGISRETLYRSLLILCHKLYIFLYLTVIFVLIISLFCSRVSRCEITPSKRWLRICLFNFPPYIMQNLGWSLMIFSILMWQSISQICTRWQRQLSLLIVFLGMDFGSVQHRACIPWIICQFSCSFCLLGSWVCKD